MIYKNAISFMFLVIILISLIILTKISNPEPLSTSSSGNFEYLYDANFYGINLDDYHISIQDDYDNEDNFDPRCWGVPTISSVSKKLDTN